MNADSILNGSETKSSTLNGGGVASADGLGVPSLWPVYAFLLSSLLCFTLSTTMHLLHSVSARVAWWVSRADFVGIASLITGACLAPVYYGFYCAPQLEATYMAAMAAAFVGVAISTMWPRFGAAEYRWLRVAAYGSLALVCFIPQAHLAWEHYGSGHASKDRDPLLQLVQGADERDPHLQLVHTYLHWMLGINSAGAVVYATRVPERWWPGRFDRIGGSHALFHLLNVAAALAHYWAVIEHYRWRAAHMDCGAM